MAKAPKVGETILLRLDVEGQGWGERMRQQMRQWAAAGMSRNDILDALERELRPGGRLFESMMKGFKNVTGEAVDYVAVEEVHDNWKGSDEWMWIAVDDNSTCEDCTDRDGEVRAWAEWEGMGLPGMGTTVCGWRCRCSLEPNDLVSGMPSGAYPGVQ